jgi:hypothetical protein
MDGKTYAQRAFPNQLDGDLYDGMTLRDWFAGQAVGGMLSGEADGSFWAAESCAKRAYTMADAMIAERNKREEAGK